MIGYTRVLNMPLVLNISWLWIYQSSEYSRVSQGSEYTWIIHECICLNMLEYAGIYGNMSEGTWICLNLPEWLLFYISSFPLLFFNPLSTRTRYYLFERLQETRGYSLKEDAWGCFLEETKFDFLYRFSQVRLKFAVTFRVWGVGCGGGGVGGRETWYTLLVLFFLVKTCKEIT